MTKHKHSLWIHYMEKDLHRTTQ